jgi:hypothetical protein
MKKLYLILTSILIISLLAACGNDSKTTKESESSTKETVSQETSSNESSNKNETESKEKEKSTNDTGINEVQTLSIGEMALIKSTIGDFEVTPKEVKIVDSIDGEKPAYDKFIEATVEVKNVSDVPLDIFDLNDSRVLSLKEDIYSDYESVEVQEQVEAIQPNETVTLNLVFDIYEDSKYELIFGNVFVSNEVHWEFSAN